MSPIRKLIMRLLKTFHLVETNKSRDKKNIYLTFDDGPNLQFTEKILDLLNHYGSKATFFLIGLNISLHPELVDKILAEGHSVGNHSLNHKNFSRLPMRMQAKEISQTDILIKERLNYQCLPARKILFRPPQGALTIGLCVYALFNKRKHYLWSVDSCDYKEIDYDKKLEYLKKLKIGNGDIILFHDDNSDTLKLLEYIIPIWINQGYSLVALVE